MYINQLNTTIHGTMKTTPYELVFGQPPRKSDFPGACGAHVWEEDVEDLLDNDSDDKPSVDDSSPANAN